MRKGTILLVFIFQIMLAHAQKDSLTRIISSGTGPDSNKVMALLQLGNIFINEQDSVKAADAFHEGLTFSKGLGFKKGVIKSMLQIGYLDEMTQNYGKALAHYNAVIEYGKQNRLYDDLARAHAYKFFIYRAKSDFPAAIASAESAYEVFKQLGRKADMANQLNNIGLLKNKQNLNKEAIGLYQQALLIYNELGPEAENKKVNTINNLGIIYESMKSYDQAFRYYQEAYKIAKRNNIPGTLFDVSNNLGNYYRSKNDFKKAYTYYYNNLGPVKQLNDPYKYALALGNLANVLTDLKDYKNADIYYQQAFKQNEKMGSAEGLATNYINYARMLGESGQLQLADSYLQKAMALVEKNNLVGFKHNIYESMAEIKKREKDYAMAYSLQDSAFKAKDSVLNTNTNKEIALLETRFQTERKEKELAKNAATISLNQLELQKKNSLLTAVGLGLLLVCILAFLIYTTASSKQRRLKAQNEFQLTLAAAEARSELQEEKLRISRELHDNIGAQLTFINSSIQGLNGNDNDVNVLSETRKVTQNTIADLRRTVWLINKQEVRQDEFIVKLADYIKPLQANNPQFKIELSSSGDCTLTPLAATNLFRIVQEGLNNSLKYANATLMHVNLASEDNHLSLEIEDNGSGFSLSDASDGYGLKNIKARVESLKGDYQIDSIIGQGTHIKINIPI